MDLQVVGATGPAREGPTAAPLPPPMEQAVGQAMEVDPAAAALPPLWCYWRREPSLLAEPPPEGTIRPAALERPEPPALRTVPAINQ